MANMIELGYNPEITIEHVQTILKRRFPEYAQSKSMGIVCLKKSFFVHARIQVKHRPKKHKTCIWIDGHMAPLAVVLFGFILHYILRGSFLDDVKDALEQELM